MQWRIPPQYGTFFQTHVDGSLHIQAADGKEMEVFTHMLMSLEAERQRTAPPPPPDTTKEEIKDSP
jgi:hypothetical protein